MMNFDLEHEHDHGHNHDENHEEEEDDDDDTALAPTPLNYDTAGAHPPPRAPLSAAAPAAESKKIMATKYRECLKNHAVSIGGHATDGCGEFMPAGDDRPLKCAACGCHRNFHRRDTDDEGDRDQHSVSHVAGGSTAFYQNTLPLYYHRGPPPLQVRTPGGGGGVMVPATSPVAVTRSHHHLQQRSLALLSPPYCRDETEEDLSRPSSSGGGSGLGKKRFRTKFTQEQKEKMTGFAERVGWKIQKHDEAEVERFCEEVKVKRQVLKVWMHNNKHTIGKIP